ncbi:UNVERIFIED_CONTAM: hypothetical protein K2H54_055127 [Gekko kuhli]
MGRTVEKGNGVGRRNRANLSTAQDLALCDEAIAACGGLAAISHGFFASRNRSPWRRAPAGVKACRH